MNEVVCPHCKKAFKVDEAGFADILKQVRDREFDDELHERMALLEKDKENAIKLAEEKTKNELQAEVAKKETELAELNAARQAQVSRVKAEKDAELAALRSKIELAEADRRLAITEAVNKSEKERDDLINELKGKDTAKQAEIAELKAEKDALLAKLQSDLTAEVAKLEAKLAAAETEKKLAVTEAVTIVEKQRDDLAGKIEIKEHEQKLLESSLKEQHEAELRIKDEQIAQYKDFKSKQSVKLLGESLEQHCEIAFRQWQSTGGFRNVYFQKDNDASLGGKGDYIYRETDDNGNEVISIMFDMKNEADDTVTKKKNEDYFKKLDRDRSEKRCEFAILVSTLEADNELYNGITDVSYHFNKMYVIRPQFFIPVVTFLRNIALNAMNDRAELAAARDQNIDITNFENELQVFQDGFMKNVKDSSNKFLEAMDGIDSTIKKLESIKEALRLSNKHLLTAGGKVENVSVKRLTKDNPTMAAKFKDLH